MKSLRKFLSDPKHRIHFVDTPKHCSWLDQIELWPSILVRRLLKPASFRSAPRTQAANSRIPQLFQRYDGQALQMDLQRETLGGLAVRAFPEGCTSLRRALREEVVRRFYEPDEAQRMLTQ